MHTDNRRPVPMGRIVATRNAMDTLVESDIILSLQPHQKGDWGDLCDEDKHLNDLALADEGRLLSAYRDSRGTKFWIITEWDRSITTVLLPEDY